MTDTNRQISVGSLIPAGAQVGSPKTDKTDNQFAAGAAIPEGAQVGSAIPEGAQIGAGSAIPEGAGVHEPGAWEKFKGLVHDTFLGSAQEHASAGMSPQENGIAAFSNAGKADSVGGGAVTGAEKGLTDTLSGTSQLLGKVAEKTGLRHKDLTSLIDGQSRGILGETAEHDTSPDGLAEKVGYGGESLIEFLMGDEALKGLSMADRLAKVSKIFGTLEKSPKLIQWLKAGANVSKAMTTLGPEERAIVQKYPILARLVGAGVDALRNGVVQGGQSLLRSGGDVGKSAEDALSMVGTSAAIGGSLGVLGGVLSKGRAAAKVVGDMSDAAAAAPSEQGVVSDLGDAISSSKNDVDSSLNNATEEADKNLASGTQAAQSDLEGGKSAAAELADARRASGREGVSDLQQGAENDFQQSKSSAEDTLVKAHGEAHQNLLDSLGDISHGALDPKELAETVNTAINKTEANTHKLYEESINSIMDRLEGSKEPVTGSPLAKKASDLLHEPMPEDHAAVALAKQGSGNTLNKDVKNLLESLASGKVKDATKKTGKVAKAAGEAGKVVEDEGKPMQDWDAQSLIKLRQEVRQWASGYMRGDINARALNRLLPAIDDTLEKLAAKSGDPEVVNQYAQLRSAYRSARELLDSKTADKLNLQNPDQALNDVGKFLLGGSNPSAKIKTLSGVVSPSTMQDIAKSKVQQLRRLAATDPQKFLREWSKISDDVKQDFFGKEMAGKVQQAADTYSQAASSATDAHSAALDAAKSQRQSALDTAKNVGRAHESAVRDELQSTFKDVQDKYKSAVQDAQNTYDSAVADAKSKHAKASEPFSGSFMKNLAEGRVNDSLLKGDVDLKDIQKVKQAVGDTKWSQIGDGIFQRGISDASPGGKFDPSKFMSWWNGIKPDVREAMFTATPEKYTAAVADVKDAASFQRLVKAGVLVTGGTILAGGTVKLAALTPMMEALAVAIGVGGKSLVRPLIEFVANHRTCGSLYLLCPMPQRLRWRLPVREH